MPHLVWPKLLRVRETRPGQVSRLVELGYQGRVGF
eukprot:COSAG01_NODE_21039_length_921_cov_1.142336_1_plen_34_part_10